MRRPATVRDTGAESSRSRCGELNSLDAPREGPVPAARRRGFPHWGHRKPGAPPSASDETGRPSDPAAFFLLPIALRRARRPVTIVVAPCRIRASPWRPCRYYRNLPHPLAEGGHASSSPDARFLPTRTTLGRPRVRCDERQTGPEISPRTRSPSIVGQVGNPAPDPLRDATPS